MCAQWGARYLSDEFGRGFAEFEGGGDVDLLALLAEEPHLPREELRRPLLRVRDATKNKNH